MEKSSGIGKSTAFWLALMLLAGSAIAQGAVSGVVFNDSNGNGLLGSIEAGLSGWIVTLSGITSGNNSLMMRATTDASGNYSFSGVPPGTYNVSETLQQGFNLTAPANTPSGLLPNGLSLPAGVVSNGISYIVSAIDNATYGALDFGNQANPPTLPGMLTVTTVVEGGNASASDFTVAVAGMNASQQTFAGNANGTSVTLGPGAYSVSETGPADYSQDLSSGCSGTIGSNQSVSCTITEAYAPQVAGVLSVYVNVVGGNAAASDFTVTVNGTNVSLASFAGSGNGTAITLGAGAYSVSVAAPSGYMQSLSADCSGTMVSNGTASCAANETFQAPAPGFLTVILDVLGGNASPADFTLNVTGNGTSAAFPGSSNGTIVSLVPGAYSVAAGSILNYFQSLSAGCSGSIAANQSLTCTVLESFIGGNKGHGDDIGENETESEDAGHFNASVHSEDQNADHVQHMEDQVSSWISNKDRLNQGANQAAQDSRHVQRMEGQIANWDNRKSLNNGDDGGIAGSLGLNFNFTVQGNGRASNGNQDGQGDD